MRSVLPDTGLWYALFDARDRYSEQAQAKVSYLELSTIVIPWPVLYETLSTRFVRNTRALGHLQRFLARPGIELLDDSPYRDAAFDLACKSSLFRARPLSMVDCALRLILDDVNTRIDCFLTFNAGDFADICRKRRIELV